MSERLHHPNHHEQEENPYGNREITPEEHQEHHKARHEKAHDSPESITNILEKIEREAKSTHELNKHHIEQDKQERTEPHHIGTHLKTHAAKQTITKAQKQLNAPERAFSKVIHNPGIETVSNIAGSTVARPSGLLSGGVFSVIGSLAFIFISRYYGYEYNFLIGVTCFIGGFFFGLVVELVFKLLRGKS